MQMGIRTAVTALVAISAWCGPTVSAVQAQLPDLSLIGDDGSAGAADQNLPELDVTLVRDSEDKNEAILSITIKVPPGGYTYSTNQDFVGATRIQLTSGLKPIDADFKADHPPKRAVDPILEETVEKYTGQVTWTRRFRVESDLDPKPFVGGKIRYQVCTSQNCRPFSEEFLVSLSNAPPKKTSDRPAAGDNVAPFKFEIRPTRGSGDREQADFVQFAFELSPKDAKPGDTVTLSITAQLDEGYHVFAQTQKLENYGNPAVIELSQTTGLKPLSDAFQPDRSPKIEDPLKEGKPQHTFYGQVTWTRKFEVTVAPFGVTGKLRYQICDENRCLAPKNVDFALGATTGQASGFPATTGAPASSSAGDDLVFDVEDTKSASLPLYLLYAFLGGLILNIMPCVLPVLAIKVMSFVQQAGESRRHIFALNVSYSAGVISVFLLLATLAVSIGLGWGGLFQNSTFVLVVACVVFAMGLSLLGVFEIPVPGFVGSAGGQQREGLLGAFLTGIFATLLATPCSGPFMGVTLAWSLRQPQGVTYLVWGVMGLGMASPYLVFGLFPGAIKWLPKPGHWMVRFKEFAGFVLMGTVIFIVYFLEETYVVPLLIMLLGISLGLWMIGNLYDMNSHIRHKMTVRVTALLLTAAIVGFGFHLNRDEADGTDLPWEPFTELRLRQSLDEGRTVLIDFTADWCLICKTVEKTALNTEETLDVVRKHNVVPLYADYTHESPEIKEWLDRFDSKSVPLTVIFPANQPDRPILIRDFYTQSKLLEKLKLAVAPGPSADQHALRRAAARE